MFSIDYYVFFEKIDNLREKNLFFFSYDEPFLLFKGIEAVMGLKGIKRKRTFLGKEFNLREVKDEGRTLSMFGREKNINIIFNADEVRFNEDLRALESDSPFVFVFDDKKNFERKKILKEMEEGVYVHFPKVDYNVAFRWFKKELKRLNKIFPDSHIMEVIKDNEGSLTKLKNILELIKLGANFEDFLKKEISEREMDIQDALNYMIFLMRRNIISPLLIWKIYEPLLYNRRVNYDYEIEIKQILRRYYEGRNKY